MTNEQWFCGLSTERKAKELQEIYMRGRVDGFFNKPQKMVKEFLAWLKEEHHADVAD